MKSSFFGRLFSEENMIRTVYMIFFVFLLKLAVLATFVVIVLQWLVRLIIGESSRALLEWGYSLREFIGQAFAFLTYHSEEKPFPFSSWPRSK
ncbi:DUF4389 domain-containing protein [Pokkaliibacter sp. MBI-7]|uniref:DUF4389 domain-containing protein n=1 Tax=Pokkaliibacter sp. MBI-7 TaxID=3040600 RepID=UPI00244AA2CE|nr:DUF4389 domain-containing protein [Pokkaliibacter sp. MBI-7]MDH2436087.1 DUF4389 domain-containing protein [Pokkaliibacter sp. MBI-7]